MVNRLHLLVHRLHLLLGGGQLLVGALQLFVGRLHLFIGGFELLMGGLHLFPNTQNLIPSLAQLLLKRCLQTSSVVCNRRFILCYGTRNAFNILKNNQHKTPQGIRLFKQLNHQIDRRCSSVRSDVHSIFRNNSFLMEYAPEHEIQFITKPIASHGKNIPVGLSSRRLKVLARMTADRDDISLVIGQDCCRSVMLQEKLIGYCLQIYGRRL